MTCSIGFAAYPFLPEDPRRVAWEEVLDIADICLYAAKGSGRNCWTGVVARDCLAPDTLMLRVRASMPALVAAGELELLASART
jgi:predicted signal transduction protein with EAL and GGDEF domain